MKTIEQLIRDNTNENGFQWGIETAMQSLRPNCHYAISCSGGNFEVVNWPDNQWCETTQRYLEPPTSQELRDEYVRQKTIAEVLDYLKENNNGSFC